MKRLYFSLIAMIAFVGFTALALADPGTTWDEKINGHHRFKVLREFGGAAVLDKETGRVWEQSPSTELFPWTVLSTPLPGATAPDALSHCYQLEVGGRNACLGDRGQVRKDVRALRPGHGQRPNLAFASDANRAWAVGFATGSVFNPLKTANREVWCVRGGQGIDGVQ